MAYKTAKQRRNSAKQLNINLPNQVFDIESIDISGKGIAHHNGKVVFVQDAITGEQVIGQITRTKPAYDQAKIVQITKPSVQRVVPECLHFGICGGCTLQHIAADSQVAIKQRALEDSLNHIAKIKPVNILPPIYGLNRAYRYRARLSVKYVIKKDQVLVGFHEKSSTYIADIQQCMVLPDHISKLIMPLRHLINTLSIRSNIPQIEVAVGEKDTVLLMRHLEPLSQTDMVSMDEFVHKQSVYFQANTDTFSTNLQTNTNVQSIKHAIVWYTQSAGLDSIQPLHRQLQADLYYTLPEFDIKILFKVNEFTQINHPMNRVLVSKAMALLMPQAGEHILDLFCGLGNFTLPLARLVGVTGKVLGIEGSHTLIDSANQQAINNQLFNIAFKVNNLFTVHTEDMYEWGSFDRWLIDPPREGAQAVCESLLNLPMTHKPKRIVYISCNPATLARDAAILCKNGQWVLSQAGIANMFPHTSHVESIAVFEWG